MQTSNKGGSNKVRRAHLLKCKEIDCPVCPLHRGDNKRGRVPKERRSLRPHVTTPKKQRRLKRGGKREL